jgi:hypothetical protein
MNSDRRGRQPSTRGRGRPYTPRPCVHCSNEAALAVQVLSRTVGLGQAGRTRSMKLSTPVLLCNECSSNNSTFIEELQQAASESLVHVQRHRRTKAA